MDLGLFILSQHNCIDQLSSNKRVDEAHALNKMEQSVSPHHDHAAEFRQVELEKRRCGHSTQLQHFDCVHSIEN